MIVPTGDEGVFIVYEGDEDEKRVIFNEKNVRLFIDFLSELYELKAQAESFQETELIEKIWKLYEEYRKNGKKVKGLAIGTFSAYASFLFPLIFFPLKKGQEEEYPAFINEISKNFFIKYYPGNIENYYRSKKKYFEFIKAINSDVELKSRVDKLEYGFLEIAFYFAIKCLLDECEQKRSKSSHEKRWIL